MVLRNYRPQVDISFYNMHVIKRNQVDISFYNMQVIKTNIYLIALEKEQEQRQQQGK